jgi:hypothetical protein
MERVHLYSTRCEQNMNTRIKGNREDRVPLRATWPPAWLVDTPADWLRAALAASPRRGDEVLQEAVAAGLDGEDTYDAARELGVQETQDGDGNFTWELKS